MNNPKLLREEKRKNRIRGKFPKEGYRLTVSRTNRYLYAQIVNQTDGKVVFGLQDKTALADQKEKTTKTEKAKNFGQLFAKQALSNKIEVVIFDRAPYRYHGRVRAFAEGAREAGLKF